MKKHVALKIMLPMILIFILTVTVNMTITSCLQNARSVFQDISASSDVSTDIATITSNSVSIISSELSRNGILSSLQLLLVIATIIITYLSLVKPLKDTEKQLNAFIEHI